MLNAQDITGLMALPPTPVLAEVDYLHAPWTVDVAEATRATGKLVTDGAGSIGLCGTTGECAALTWAEKLEFYSAVRDTVAGRVPLFAGATTLGTRDTIDQMRALVGLGIDGAFVGLPLWQTPTLANAVRFYADLAEAVPEMPILVYGNSFFFKFDYPVEFWQGCRVSADDDCLQGWIPIHPGGVRGGQGAGEFHERGRRNPWPSVAEHPRVGDRGMGDLGSDGP